MIGATKRLTRFLLASFLMIAAAHVSAQNTIEGLRIWPSPTNTRIVFDLEQQPEYTYFTLANPHRIVVDLKNTSRQIDFSQFANDSKLVKRVRHSTPKNQSSTRVVIELTKQIKPQIFALEPTPPYKNRLVIDLADDEALNQTLVTTSEQKLRDRDIIIALDAGHGGEDPGSIGRAGTF